MTVRVLPALLVVILMGVLPSVSHAQARRVAVLDFANTAKDPAVEALGPAIAETLTTKLHSLRALHLVERDRLYRLLQEQRLHQTDLVDPSHAVHVGRLLGAERVVLGTYVKRGDSVRVTARFVDTATGAIVATNQVQGTYDPKNPHEFWAALDQLAQATIDSLNAHVVIVQARPEVVLVPPARRIEPTPEERTRLMKPPTRSLEAQEAYGRGLLSYKRGEYAEAAREFERATSMDADYVDAWVSLGAALGNLGQFPRAVTAFERAYRLYLALGDEPGQASTLGRIGVEYDRQHRSADALVNYEGSLKLLMKLGDESGQAKALHNMGVSYTRQGRSADALEYHARALALEQKLGNEAGQATTLYAIGLAYEVQGHSVEALASYGHALALQQKLGNEAGQEVTVTRMGDVHGSQGRHVEALASYGHALALQQKLGDEAGQARTLNTIGLVYAKQARYADALKSYERAFEIAERLGMPERESFRRLRDQMRSQLRSPS